MKEELEHVIAQLESLDNEFIECAKRFFEADKANMYALDLFAIAVCNRAKSLTKAYVTLVKELNVLSAVSLIRLQLDNSLRFHAAMLVKDSNEFVGHYLDGREIRDLKDSKGKNLTDNYLARSLDKYFKGTLNLYKEACGYVHLSSKHFFPTVNKTEKESRKIQVVIGGTEFDIDETVSFSKTMFEVSKLAIVIIEQWKHEKTRIGKFRDIK